jgi:hypothetical protein
LGLYGKLFGREQNTPETERERDIYVGSPESADFLFAFKRKRDFPHV